jgi:hypothetical protein
MNVLKAFRPILVRSEKTKKVLHKFTWNGGKFQAET